MRPAEGQGPITHRVRACSQGRVRSMQEAMPPDQMQTLASHLAHHPQQKSPQKQFPLQRGHRTCLHAFCDRELRAQEEACVIFRGSIDEKILPQIRRTHPLGNFCPQVPSHPPLLGLLSPLSWGANRPLLPTCSLLDRRLAPDCLVSHCTTPPTQLLGGP